MKRQYLQAFLAFLLAVCLLAGCQSVEVPQAEDKGDAGKTPDNDQTPDNEETPAENDEAPDRQEKIVLQNNAFRIFEPEPESSVKGKIVVRGKARVFEATFQYAVKDEAGNLLTEGFTMASEGAPAWGDFHLTINLPEGDYQRVNLIIYESSAMDGSPQNVLEIPLNVKQ